MKNNNSNSTAENSNNSVNNNSTRGNLKESTSSYNNTEDSQFNVCKTDANNNTIFEKTVTDINQAVCECCKCDNMDKAAKAPQFENTPEGAQKAAQWLSDNNSKYNFTIEASNTSNANSRNADINSTSNQKSRETSEVDS